MLLGKGNNFVMLLSELIFLPLRVSFFSSAIRIKELKVLTGFSSF